jgi:hypothetical protein
VVLRDCGGSRPSILWLLRASRQGWYLPTVSGALNVTSCMTPKVRFLVLFVCSYAWGLILASCMWCSIR